MSRTASASSPAAPATATTGPFPGIQGRSPRNLYERAYEAIEARLVDCTLAPGRYLAIQELQELVQLGRTPVHLAVTRLSEETLLRVHPRRGLQIAPIDLARERLLLRLRRDLERFVIRLAAEKSSAAHRNQMRHLLRQLHAQHAHLSITAFNLIDRQLDRLFLAAAAEPFIAKTLQPLHTMSPRIGWLYHHTLTPPPDPALTIEPHLALLEAVAHGETQAAIAASETLIDFVDSMFDALEAAIDPTLLDCSVQHYDLA